MLQELCDLQLALTTEYTTPVGRGDILSQTTDSLDCTHPSASPATVLIAKRRLGRISRVQVEVESVMVELFQLFVRHRGGQESLPGKDGFAFHVCFLLLSLTLLCLVFVQRAVLRLYAVLSASLNGHQMTRTTLPGL